MFQQEEEQEENPQFINIDLSDPNFPYNLENTLKERLKKKYEQSSNQTENLNFQQEQLQEQDVQQLLQQAEKENEKNQKHAYLDSDNLQNILNNQNYQTELDRQKQQELERKQQQYEQSQPLQFRTILNITGSRCSKSTLEYFFSELQQSKNVHEFQKNAQSVLFGNDLGVKKPFEEIILQADIQNNSEEVKSPFENQQVAKDRPVVIDGLQKKEENSDQQQNQQDENLLVLNIHLKDRKLFKKYLKFYHQQQANFLCPYIGVKFQDPTQTIDLTAKKSLFTPFKKDQLRLDYNQPIFNHPDILNLKYVGQITSKKLFSNIRSNLNNITEQSCALKLRIYPKKLKNQHFQIKQKYRKNVYSSNNWAQQQLDQRNLDNYGHFSVKGWYYPEAKDRYRVINEAGKEIVCNNLQDHPEIQDGETIQIISHVKHKNSLKYSGNLVWRNKIFTEKPYVYGRVQFKNSVRTLGNIALPYKQKGIVHFSNWFMADGILSSDKVQVNDQLKLKNVLGFKEIIQQNQNSYLSLAFQDRFKIAIDDFPLFQRYGITPYFHFSFYCLPNFGNQQQQLIANNNSNNNSDNGQSKLKNILNRIGQSKAAYPFLNGSRVSAGFGVKFLQNMQLTYNFFGYNGSSTNLDTFSQIQFNINNTHGTEINV